MSLPPRTYPGKTGSTISRSQQEVEERTDLTAAAPDLASG